MREQSEGEREGRYASTIQQPAVPFKPAIHESAQKYFDIAVERELRDSVKGELVNEMLYHRKWEKFE